MPNRWNDTVDILLVDDRPDGLLAMEALLSEKKNYHLVTAPSGLEAIQLVAKHDFAVILLDVQMPHLDGFQTAERIRTNPQFANIPIIFVTAINKDDRYVYRGYETGAVDYIFKPFDPMILRSKVAVFADLHLQKRMVRFQAEELSRREAIEHRAYLQSVELDNLRRYRNLADAIPHIVWRASSDGTLEYYNQLWCVYTGMNLEESMGVGWQKAFHSDDLKLLLRKWMKAIQIGESFEMECRIRRYDGVFRWHWIQAVAEKNANAQTIAWLGTCTDIQDRKNSEKKLIEAQKSAEAASQAKTQFLANMSHEIRTPLSAIMGFTELMLDPHLSDEEKTNNLLVVQRNSQQLLKIIDEILDISKVESGRLEIEKVETDLMDVFSSVISLLRVSAESKGIALRFRILTHIPDHVWSDSTRLRQILINVIGNAVKFTHQGFVEVQATYGMLADGTSQLRLIVQDTGIGLDPETSQKLFTPFLQADSSTTRMYGGTGLGLALSRQLARAMGGDVWLERTELEKGSSFAIEINAEPTDDAEWVNADQESQTATDFMKDASSRLPVIPEPRKELAGAKILLVEDAEDNQALISLFLKRAGAEIDMANNGREGVEMALKNDYAVVLMDIQMPFLDGYEATTKLRQAGYDRPIIALTAHALREEREKAIRTGCNGHLTKPIDRLELIESLKKYIPPGAPLDAGLRSR
jgi:PAS domain S-box-containing protein